MLTIPMLRALVILLAGYVAARVARTMAGKAAKGRLDDHHTMIAQLAAFWIVLGLFGVTAANELGFNLQVLLGAAGILTIAVGFASQTSASNLISGLFLIGERPFSVGDLIKVGDTIGVVISIDLLSVKLRTFDNLYVRIPNETLIKTEIVTYTRFPVRRVDFTLGVAYKEDLERVRGIVMDVADKNPLCLDEPQPVFIFKGFGASSQDFLFCVWTLQANFLETLNSVAIEIKRAFDREGIEIPFPQVVVNAAAAPLALTLKDDRGKMG
ncbi:MAG: mechanosensitive ion channel family protein [Nitrospinae bacterium]|nr:mechanosensitive ion channel family protein [Nitrospinota bacterium]